MFFSVLCLLCLCARLFICALRSPAGKGLTSWLSFVVSNCEFVTFPLVSWVRCGTWLYRFLIFAPLLTLNLSITNGIISSKIYNKRDGFKLEVENFPFLDGDVSRSPSWGVYISQLIRFTRVCSNVDDFNNRNLFLTVKLWRQGYRYHKIRKAFSKFYHRHLKLTVKFIQHCVKNSSATRHIRT